MAVSELRARALALVVCSMLLAESAAAAAPVGASAASAGAPSVAPSSSTAAPAATASTAPASPAPSPSPTPSSAPGQEQAPASASPVGTPVPTPTPIDPSTGLVSGASEVPSARTENSQTWDNHDGTFTTQYFTSPVFYKPAGSSTWQPIDVGFAPAAAGGLDYLSAEAPATVGVADTSATSDFLTTTYSGRTIGFRVPSATAKAAGAVKPKATGRVADYTGFAPGIDLRVVAGAKGPKSYFIWRAAPASDSISYVVDAAGLTLSPQPDGSIAMLDGGGATVASIPRPYAVDSTPDAFAGGGRYTDLVALALGADGKTITVTVDPSWLKTAVYPVYVDPSVTWFNAGGNTYGDAHTASKYAGDNFDDYQRPDAPGYHELWNGIDPSGTSGESFDYLRWDVSSLAGSSIDSATLYLYPYHQYYNAPTVENTAVRQVSASSGAAWTESGVTWKNQPSAANGYAYVRTVSAGACVESTWCTWDVADMVQDWANGTRNNGFQVDTNGHDSHYWKRFVSSEQGGTARPKLSVTYHLPTATPVVKVTPSGDPSVAWTYADPAGHAQTAYQVQLSSDGGETWSIDSTAVSGASTSWTPRTALADSTYLWHVRVKDGTAWSAWSANQSFVLQTARGGDESYYLRVPFDLPGGWRLDVGTFNGEARLKRALFSVPSYGPPQDLTLAYSSFRSTVGGPFGAGWRSNIGQTLEQAGARRIWHRDDGGEVVFTGSDAAGWSAVAPHADRLQRVAGDYLVTTEEGLSYTFEGAGAGRPTRITNRQGKSLTLQWAPTSVAMTDDSGRSSVLVLNSSGLVITAQPSGASVPWRFAYSGTSVTSDLVSVTDPTGASTSLAYDASHRLSSIDQFVSAAATAHWQVAYDAAGRVRSVTDPIATLTMSSPVGARFSYLDGRTEVRWPEQYAVSAPDKLSTFAFDPAGWAISADSDSFSWNAAGLIAQSTQDDGTGVTVTTVYTYSGRNLISEVSSSSSTTYAYDGDGNVISEVDVIDGVSHTTTRVWDASDRLVEERVDVGTVSERLTQFAYNSRDLVSAIRGPNGSVTAFVYDDYGNLTRQTSNCTDSSDAATALPTDSDWRTCTGAGIHDESWNATSTYDFPVGSLNTLAGLATSATLTDEPTFQYQYDAVGRRIQEQLANGYTLRHTYDGVGDEVLTLDSDAGPTARTFDLMGRLTSVTEPMFGQTLTEYDALGQVSRQIVDDANDSRIKRVFDRLDRLIAVQSADGTVTAYSYTPTGFTRIDNCTDSVSPTPGGSNLGCRGLGVQDGTWNVMTTGTGDPLVVQPSYAQTNTRYAVLIHGLVDFDWNIKTIDVSTAPGTRFGEVKRALTSPDPTGHSYSSVVALAYYGHEANTADANDASKSGLPSATGTRYMQKAGCWVIERRVDLYVNSGGPAGLKESGTYWTNHQHRTRSGCRQEYAPLAMHSTDTGIRHLAYHVAWFIYSHYYKKGISAVDVVGHSLGGVIIRTAEESVEAASVYQDYARDGGANRWPRTLSLQDVVTLGSPHAGVTDIAGIVNSEMGELGEGRWFVTYLRHYPVLYGDWTLVGSDKDCVLSFGPISFCIPPSSSLGRYTSGPRGPWNFGQHNVVYRDVSGHCSIVHDDYWKTVSCGPLAVYGAAGFSLVNTAPATSRMPIIWARDEALASYDY